MTETRHKTIIDVHTNIAPARRDVADLQAMIDRVSVSAGKITVGGAGGPVGGAAGAAVGGAAAGGASGGVGASPGQGRRERDDRRDPAIKQSLLGQQAAMAISSFGGGVPGMVAGSGMMVQGLLRSAGKRMTESTNRFFAGLGQSFAGGIFGNVLGPLMTVTGAGVSGLIQAAQMKAGITTTLNQASLGLGTSIDTNKFLKHTAKTGWDPQAASQVALQWAQAKGTTEGGGYQTALRVARTGASVGAAAQYEGLKARGAGGIGGGVMSAIASAQAQGMRGSGIDKWLQIIAQHTSQMAQGGLDVSLGDMEKFVRSMQGTKGIGGQGYRLPQIAGALGRQPLQARQQLLGGFGGLGQAAVMAQAAGGGGSIMDMLKNIEGMQGSPEAVRQAVIGMFGPEMAALFFAQQGAPSGMAEALTGQMAPGVSGGVRQFQPSAGTALAGKLASKRLGDITDREIETMIGAQGKLTAALDDLGSVIEKLLAWIKSMQKKWKKGAFPT